MEIIERLEQSLPNRCGAEPLLPIQYYDLVCRSHVLEGEHRLMLAVLEDAIHNYLKNMTARTRRQRILFYEVREWINSRPRNGSALFAFETLCTSLGIDASALRRALEARAREIERGRNAQSSSRPAAHERQRSIAVSQAS